MPYNITLVYERIHRHPACTRMLGVECDRHVLVGGTVHHDVPLDENIFRFNFVCSCSFEQILKQSSLSIRASVIIVLACMVYWRKDRTNDDLYYH